MAKKALIFHGGWDGHHPGMIADLFGKSLEARGFEVVKSDSLSCLDDSVQLQTFDLIVPCWTMGELSKEQEKNLCEAVGNGTGIAGAHGGMGDAFRNAMTYNEMVGGRFVSHPYVGPYTVRVVQLGHPLVHGLPEKFVYDSEQYYLHVDPGLNVLLSTDYDVGDGTVDMPVAWTRKWGKGKVFYCALGHQPKEYEDHPAVWEFIVSGTVWAAR